MKVNPETIARASSRRPWVTVALWVLVIVIAMATTSTLLADTLTTDFDFTDEPESKRAQVLVEEQLRGP